MNAQRQTERNGRNFNPNHTSTQLAVVYISNKYFSICSFLHQHISPHMRNRREREVARRSTASIYTKGKYITRTKTASHQHMARSSAYQGKWQFMPKIKYSVYLVLPVTRPNFKMQDELIKCALTVNFPTTSTQDEYLQSCKLIHKTIII